VSEEARGHGDHLPLPLKQRVTVSQSGPGPHAGVIIGWERRGERWYAQVAYVIEGDEALIVQWLPDDLLRPAEQRPN
jgi:hypothetical protein